MRGKGYGLSLFKFAMERMKARGCTTVGLDGVEELVLYRSH